MTVVRSEWDGLLQGRIDPTDVIRIEVPLAPSPAGGSGTFLALASDGNRWWVKPLNNLQGTRVVATEHVVGHAGELIGAPACEVAVVEIPADLVGWEFRPGSHLEAGFAHGSLAVEDAQESRALDFRQRDDNRRRHAGVFALYDWCWGGDDQWLYCETDERKLYSHDHGWYLPEVGPDWSEATLAARVDEPHPAAYPHDDLDAGALGDFADRLEAVSRAELVALLAAVPASWPVPGTDLDALGFFLERRAPAVAGRLRAMIGGAP